MVWDNKASVVLVPVQVSVATVTSVALNVATALVKRATQSPHRNTAALAAKSSQWWEQLSLRLN